MANLLATMRAASLILLVVSAHASGLQRITLSPGRKAAEERIDSQSLFRKLGFRNVKPSERRALMDPERTVPEGPDHQHHYAPPTSS
ncbi:uncharacterized protein LOC115729321 [Rhodamnia argentea]|uniref:Uncharacterized protein LOC115729321 n=1 Tax=Rhodamnia argentea TaxID=178133 RepID=A0A8B8N012_9MYRT|nr:uncharacterized protein LOC115729321 [Rhodamnia argentea]